MTDAVPSALTTSFDESVYGALYEAYQQGDYQAILGPGVAELLADDPDKDQTMAELAGEVLSEYHQNMSGA